MAGRSAYHAAIVAGVFALASACARSRGHESDDTRAHTPASTPAARTPVAIDVEAGDDSAYARCIRRPDGTIRPYDEVEPYAAAHPRAPSILLAAWMVQGAGRGHPMRTAVSLDGGRTWGRRALVPFGPCGWSDPDFTSSSDPWVAIDAAGRMYVAAIVFRTVSGRMVSAGVAVSVSADTGRTWGAAVLPIAERSPRYFNDNVAITAHPRVAGTAYLLTTRYEPSDPARPDTAIMARATRVAPAVLSITRDGGHTWTAPAAITPRPRGMWAGAPQLTVDERTGTLWVVYTTRANGAMRVELVKSVDDGRSWSSPIDVVTYTSLSGDIVYPGSTRVLGVADDLVHLAVDAKRRQLWVAFTDGRHSGGRVAQVSVTASADDGRTWSAPVRVNGDTNPSWRPTIGIASDGGAIVAYLTPDSVPRSAADSLAFPTRVESRRVTRDASGIASLHDIVELDRFLWRPTRTDEHFLGDYFGMTPGTPPTLVYSRTTTRGARVHAVPVDTR